MIFIGTSNPPDFIDGTPAHPQPPQMHANGLGRYFGRPGYLLDDDYLFHEHLAYALTNALAHVEQDEAERILDGA
jgi:hypothetical protein